ncbi:MAG: lytic transglycosylase domain-containing protein, partial [Rhizobiales bacterium]|nr:lytic transglycosylase domain-containing protein [Hyphomicrobiales bacterium]
MIRKLCLASILAALVSTPIAFAQDQRVARLDANGNLGALIARHAAANNVPEELVRRVIKRESGGNVRAVSKGNYGVMQIRLGTARALGYRGSAAGLLDPDTNMTYAVKYLAGAYHAADGNANRAVHYYAAGYYYAA